MEKRPSRAETPKPFGTCNWNIAHKGSTIVDQYGNSYTGENRGIAINQVLCNGCRIELLKIQEVPNPE